MDDPEDMRELVVGMASSAMFTKVFSEAAYQPQDQTLAQWFNTETSTFGGEDAVNTVRDLFGHVSRFDFGEVSNRIPRVDLPQLVPFMKAVLAVRGRRPGQRDKLRLSVRTPQEWQDDFAVADQYELLFGREPRPAEGEDIAGVGHRGRGPGPAGCSRLARGRSELSQDLMPNSSSSSCGTGSPARTDRFDRWSSA